MRLYLHITQGRHNEVHSILLSMDDQPPFLSKATSRDLGGLVDAGFGSTEIANAQKQLIEKGTTVLEGLDIDEHYVRQFFADAA